MITLTDTKPDDAIISGKISSCEIQEKYLYTKEDTEREFPISIIQITIWFSDGRVMCFPDIGQNTVFAQILADKMIGKDICPEGVRDIILDFVNEPDMF